jgi:hypothetical protein
MTATPSRRGPLAERHPAAGAGMARFRFARVPGRSNAGADAPSAEDQGKHADD